MRLRRFGSFIKAIKIKVLCNISKQIVKFCLTLNVQIIVSSQIDWALTNFCNLLVILTAQVVFYEYALLAHEYSIITWPVYYESKW